MELSLSRKSVPIGKRVVPCQCCQHPLSHRHHIYPFAYFGESYKTVQLCANCHEICHLYINAFAEQAKGNMQARSVKLIGHLQALQGMNDMQLEYLRNLAYTGANAIQQKKLHESLDVFETLFGASGDESHE